MAFGSCTFVNILYISTADGHYNSGTVVDRNGAVTLAQTTEHPTGGPHISVLLPEVIIESAHDSEAGRVRNIGTHI